MTNNDVLRRIRYLFDFNDFKMIALFKLANYNVKKEDVCAWLKKEDDPLSIEITDKELSTFLNGLIIEKRGRKEGPLPEAEDPINNNIILRKLKIALNLKAEDIINLFALVDIKISKPELSAFFRRPNHKYYKLFLDQYLRNFLNALQTKYKNKPENIS
ncbi:MAG: DUF1456 family protein [Bacteroidetes bacterium]|nr:DUF1456 family protein [Bacteroidota bacterium]